MDERAGSRGTVSGGVFFTEDPHAQSRLPLPPLKVEISRQNANLGRVKERLAEQVRQMGGNALVGFTYGQRSHSIWQQLFTLRWDTESWHGAGWAAVLPEAGPTGHDPGRT